MSDKGSDVWDLTLRIQGLSVRRSGSTNKGVAARPQPEAESGAVSPFALSSAFSVVSDPTRAPSIPTSEPESASAAPASPPRRPSVSSVPEYSQGSSQSPEFEAGSVSP